VKDQTLPERYAEMADEELAEGIRRARERLGREPVILGHHYQADSVIQFADYTGDSLELSRRAAEVRDARYIVFCGVNFMAETAAMLCDESQVVCQPAVEAFCPMAHLASPEDIVTAWDALTGVWGDDLVPITYQNSVAAAKAEVGRRGGAVCTSSNAEALFRWAFGQKGHILFTPDEHLGTNTALAMGIPQDEIGLWDPVHPPNPQTLAHCRVVVWKGYCYVHTTFKPEDVDAMRAKYPDARVVVHPECPHDVVAKADAYGSTTRIIKYVREAPSGSTVVVGTEWHLVNRLQQQHPDKTVVPLRRVGCRTMGMTRMNHLLYVLDGLLEGTPRNVVTVDKDTTYWAGIALERMLAAN
jgi:quinolinate synthase